MTQEEALKALEEIDNTPDHIEKLRAIFIHGKEIINEPNAFELFNHPKYQQWVKENSELFKEVIAKTVKTEKFGEVFVHGDDGWVVVNDYKDDKVEVNEPCVLHVENINQYL